LAILRVVTLFIHAIVAAMASMLAAVFTHLLPMVLVVVVSIAAIAAALTSFGIGGVAILKRKRKADR
jgi:hypothetical protein